jgi:hypothetical protein
MSGCYPGFFNNKEVVMNSREIGAPFRKTGALEQGHDVPPDGYGSGWKEKLESLDEAEQEKYAMRNLVRLELYPQVVGVLLEEWLDACDTEARWKDFLRRAVGISPARADRLMWCARGLRFEPIAEREKWVSGAAGFLTDAVLCEVRDLFALPGEADLLQSTPEA